MSKTDDEELEKMNAHADAINAEMEVFLEYQADVFNDLNPLGPEDGARWSAINGVVVETVDGFSTRTMQAYRYFRTEEEAQRNELRELAMRKLCHFAEMSNPKGWNPDGEQPSSFWHGRECIEGWAWVPGGIIPFHSEKACAEAWENLTEEEIEALTWKPL